MVRSGRQFHNIPALHYEIGSAGGLLGIQGRLISPTFRTQTRLRLLRVKKLT